MRAGQSVGEPSLEQGAAHLAGADEDERGRQRRPGADLAHASPSVSNSTASRASRAVLPAQITNWNAWK